LNQKVEKMDAVVSDYIFQPSILAQLLAGTAGLAAFAFGVSAVIPKISNILIPKPKATRLGDHLKFKSLHTDRKTIICDDGVFAVVVNFGGVDLRFNEPSRQKALNNARQVWIEQMNEMKIRMRIFFVRDRLPKGSDYPHKHGIMEQVSTAWNKGLPRALSTEFYAVLSVKDDSKGVKGGPKGLMRLEEALEQTKSIMADYRPTELFDTNEVSDTIADAPRIDGREETMSPVAFFSRMLSPLSRPVPFPGREDTSLSYKMATDNVRYDSELGMFEFSNGPERKYAAVFVIEEWTSPMMESHMLELLAYPIEMTICHDINPIGKGAAIATLRWQEKLAPGLQPGSDAAIQFSTVAGAIERGSEEEQEISQVQTTITVYGDTPEEVIAGRNQINQLKMVGITPVWPKHTMVQHWFGHFPGFDSMSRPQRLLSGEISLLTTFQHTPTGKMRSDWGEGPIAMFETIDGSPYAFNFHVGEGSPPLGHCVVIGPSGQGKTTIVTFLAAMALRHPDVKAFFFDRGRGCEVITRALQGSYIFFNGNETGAGLNPMQLDDNPQNRAFLKEWLELIGDVKSDEYRYQEEISDAVEINFDPNLTMEQRNLQQLYNAVFPPDSDLRQRLIAWTNPSQWGSLVCAERDTLDISQRVAGFDFTDVLGNERLGPAMVSYIMHRILAEAKAQPRLIFIDETEPLLRNENFRLRFKKLLQEGRKERQVIISAFQRPQAPDEVGVGDTIRGQCPTVFFFRNPQAEEKDYADWRLTPRELDFVLGKSYRKKKYAVLVKRYTENGESIILNTDLSTLGNLMKIFHSGRQNVLHMEEMVKLHPEDYVQHYLSSSVG
jgi:type IV secretion system protein VirB4